MATGKVIGQIQAVSGNIKIVGVDGTVREAKAGTLMYEKEQIVSSDSSALFQIKFLAIPEAAVYSGAFRILADVTSKILLIEQVFTKKRLSHEMSLILLAPIDSFLPYLGLIIYPIFIILALQVGVSVF